MSLDLRWARRIWAIAVGAVWRRRGGWGDPYDSLRIAWADGRSAYDLVPKANLIAEIETAALRREAGDGRLAWRADALAAECGLCPDCALVEAIALEIDADNERLDGIGRAEDSARVAVGDRTRAENHGRQMAATLRGLGTIRPPEAESDPGELAAAYREALQLRAQARLQTTKPRRPTDYAAAAVTLWDLTVDAAWSAAYEPRAAELRRVLDRRSDGRWLLDLARDAAGGEPARGHILAALAAWLERDVAALEDRRTRDPIGAARDDRDYEAFRQDMAAADLDVARFEARHGLPSTEAAESAR